MAADPPDHPVSGPRRSPRLRTVLRWALLPVTVALLAWVIAPVARDWNQVEPMLMRPAVAVALGLGSLAYAACLWLFMAPGWWWLTSLYGRRVAPLPAGAVWCRTQIIKYLPGNVAHYVGRQVLGRRLGLHHAEMAAASLLELVSILGAAALIGVLGLTLGAHRVADADGALGPGAAQRLWVALPILAGLVVAGLLAWPIADALARRVPLLERHMADLPRLAPLRSLRLLGPTVVAHAAFLSLTGTILWWLVEAASPGTWLPLSRTIWVYAVAWAVGTTTPGGGGGMGVREAVLTLELSHDMGRPEAAAIALALRGVTMAGDGLAFAASLVVPIKSPGPAVVPA